MSPTDIALLISALGGILSAIVTLIVSTHKNKSDKLVSVRSAALEEMEASLTARAEDYNRILAEVLELRAQVKELNDRLTEKIRKVDALLAENAALKQRIGAREGHDGGIYHA